MLVVVALVAGRCCCCCCGRQVHFTITHSLAHSLTRSLSPSGSVPFCTGLLSCTHGHPTKIIIITNPSSMELLLLHMRHGHYNYATTASYVLSLCRSHHISRFSGCWHFCCCYCVAFSPPPSKNNNTSPATTTVHVHIGMPVLRSVAGFLPGQTQGGERQSLLFFTLTMPVCVIRESRFVSADGHLVPNPHFRVTCSRGSTYLETLRDTWEQNNNNNNKNRPVPIWATLWDVVCPNHRSPLTLPRVLSIHAPTIAHSIITTHDQRLDYYRATYKVGEWV